MPALKVNNYDVHLLSAGVIEPFPPHSQSPPPEQWLGGKTTIGAL